ncbi:MAG: glycerol kinase GlpK [Bacteroidaceae bacterium]|nr:glycerol kinase GlpK [Bacteroidaceae bacterium]
MKEQYILAIDQGTSSSRAIIFNSRGESCAVAQKEFTQHFPASGWVEHNPNEIWSSEAAVIGESMASLGISGDDIAAIGITNQRETTILWDAETGEPVYNAIVWQDRRTAEYCDQLKAQGVTDMIRQKTGLIIDAYFSATKIKWILDNVAGARERAEQGKLRFGTVDSWLVWQLTGGSLHVTDATNASRTMLFNIHTLEWDEELLRLFDIPRALMPEVKSCSEVYGYTQPTLFGKQVPIGGMAGDQQAALFGQLCTEPGSVKNTYGTGCFLLMNSGETPIMSANNLLTTIALKINGKVTYALEGSIFVGGSVVQWLRDGLGIIKSSGEIEALAATVPDTGGVYFVPALTGMGAPYWDQYARGSITGISRGTTAAHIARAALEGIAFQTLDIVEAMQRDAQIPLRELKVDGGASRNNLMMQFQADILNTKVIRPKNPETTALGAAYLAGLAVGYWDSIETIRKQWAIDSTFTPTADRQPVADAVRGWREAIKRTVSVVPNP